MKTVEILRKLINIYYYLLVIGFIGVTFLILIHFNNGKTADLRIIEGYDASNIGFGELLALTIIPFFIFLLFVRAVYLLKSTLKDLSEGNYFSDLVIKHFKKIGKLILICGLSYAMFKFVARLILLSDIRLGLDYSLITPIVIGLFFMFLSEVFAKAKETKEENDLTI